MQYTATERCLSSLAFV